MSEQWLHIDPNGIIYTLIDGVTTRYLGDEGFGLENLQPITARTPYTHGAEPLGLYAPPRELTLAIGLWAASGLLWQAQDNVLARTVSPFGVWDATLERPALHTLRRVTEDGRTRDIDVWLIQYSKPSSGRSGPLWGRRLLRYWAPYPFFYDPTEQTETLALGGDGGIVYPVTFPVTFDSTAIDAYVYPDNQGDIETWPRLRINGPGANIVITNETVDKKVELSAGGGLTLDVGDYVEIDMDAGTIDWYDASAGTTTSILEKMSADSEFWYLVRGVNTIHAVMTAAYTGSIVFNYYLYYQDAA
jgi:hypothetical protein